MKTPEAWKIDQYNRIKKEKEGQLPTLEMPSNQGTPSHDRPGKPGHDEGDTGNRGVDIIDISGNNNDEDEDFGKVKTVS